jgi:hypothetical protein
MLWGCDLGFIEQTFPVRPMWFSPNGPWRCLSTAVSGTRINIANGPGSRNQIAAIGSQSFFATGSETRNMSERSRSCAGPSPAGREGYTSGTAVRIIQLNRGRFRTFERQLQRAQRPPFEIECIHKSRLDIGHRDPNRSSQVEVCSPEGMNATSRRNTLPAWLTSVRQGRFCTPIESERQDRGLIDATDSAKAWAF